MITKMLAAVNRTTCYEAIRWRIHEKTLASVRSNASSLGIRTVKTRHGFRFRCNTSEWLGSHVYACGDYEPSTAKLIASLLNPDSTFLDIGANAGFFSLLASKIVKSGRVHSFEPVSGTFKALQQNVQINSASNVSLHQIACSNLDASMVINLGPASHTGVSSFRHTVDDSPCSETVRTRRLDSLLNEIDFGTITLMKIDVEGAEHMVIEGAKALLRSNQPDIILEMTDKFLRDLDSSATKLHDDLSEMGYRMFEITHDGLLFHGECPEFGSLPDQFNAFYTTNHPTGSNGQIAIQFQ